MTQQTQPNYTYGYQRFQEAGRKLKGDQPVKRPYEKLSVIELEKRKAIAEIWLKENQQASNYSDGLERYEQICDELTFRQAKEALL